MRTRDHRRGGGIVDPTSSIPLVGAFATNTRPAVPVPQSQSERWDAWANWSGRGAGQTREGVPILSDVPTGLMDASRSAPRGLAGIVGEDGRVLSGRARAALMALPWWQRWLAGMFFRLGAFVARLERRRRGAAKGQDKPIVQLVSGGGDGADKPPIRIISGPGR